MTTASTTLRIPADHPALAGHFPGNPLVPATVILDAVRQAIEALLPGRRLSGVSQAKFLSPLRPEQDARIEVDASGDVVRFTCLRDADIIATGEMILISED